MIGRLLCSLGRHLWGPGHDYQTTTIGGERIAVAGPTTWKCLRPGCTEG